ncbi:hypothetical protein GWK_02510 [Chlamydia psittaci CP3]|nr:conserved hypothetical protein [Chlamydia psittaci 6BC]KPZ37154.1 hypothetical protein GWK_02510 [Chlamydia psittaci CP3]KPZ37824.1 hypothetical protein GWG_04190 [Chlamydia psittaci DD34]KPZ39152.1 hypothetical protein GWI_02500 [Chlamydia psittaci str. Frances]KXH24621.1 hypothetical protein P059_02510 [Chlamydia psittaci UGA]
MKADCRHRLKKTQFRNFFKEKAETFPIDSQDPLLRI